MAIKIKQLILSAQISCMPVRLSKTQIERLFKDAWIRRGRPSRDQSAGSAILITRHGEFLADLFIEAKK